MIPQEIKDKIDELWPPDLEKLGDKEWTKMAQERMGLARNAAHIGYSLALPTIEAQEERIKQLEEELKRFKYPYNYKA